MPHLPPNAPTWTDVVLFSMGLFLVTGFLAGYASAVPLRIAGSAGSLGAALTFLSGIAWNPSARTSD